MDKLFILINEYLNKNHNGVRMIDEEYHKLLTEIVDINIEISSIADSRRLIVELNERESILIKLRENVVKDIRVAESDFLKEKAAIRNKYSMNQKSGLTGLIRGSSKSKLIKELKQLDSRSQTEIEGLKEIRYLIDDLILQFNDLKDPLNRSMRERFGN
jgi:type III secretory pathway component EscV